MAGHFEGDLPTIMQTKHGHLLKPLPSDDRGTRELEFYQCVEQARTSISSREGIRSDVQPFGVPAIDQNLTFSLMRVKGYHSLAVDNLKQIVSYFPRCCMLPSKLWFACRCDCPNVSGSTRVSVRSADLVTEGNNMSVQMVWSRCEVALR